MLLEQEPLESVAEGIWELGKTVHKRFIRCAKSGVWQMIFNTLAVDIDNEWIMIDSTIIRAHQHAAGALKI